MKLANTVTFDRMDRTVDLLSRIVLPGDTLPAIPAGNMMLIKTLLAMKEPKWSAQVPLSFRQMEDQAKNDGTLWYGDRLNESQKEAIEFCLKAEDFACIHGPPGVSDLDDLEGASVDNQTGKTHTLVELIFQLLSRPAYQGSTLPPRILVTTPSNLALDNLLLRLHALSKVEPYASLLPPGSILRLGHPTRVHRDLLSETLDYRAVHGDDGELVRDVGREIDGHVHDLSRKRGEKGAVKGKERGAKWAEVRELRKE